MPVPRIRVDEVRALLDRGEPVFFLDARNPRAWASADATLPRALRVPADEVAEHLDQIPRDQTVVAYCT